MKELGKFNEKFDTSRLELCSFGSWKASVRPVQVTPGSLVLSLQRETFSLANLTAQEALDLAEALKGVESLLSKSFSPDKINYLALMMVDPIVHFHVIPRYAGSVNFQGSTYSDQDWPKPSDLLAQRDSLPSAEGVATYLREYASS